MRRAFKFIVKKKDDSVVASLSKSKKSFVVNLLPYEFKNFWKTNR